ncbi:hypothetical protein [Lysinibacillus xylanilyticus]|uniref:hypothetical protein n=1 Tax=Lysinibacillus xylanilyticus TaxID=582475 RepID=UPI0012FE5E57|nr:hypothetical protein [Lysinibacillus xylanilyticus]
MQIYYSNDNGEHCVYIDEGERQHRIFLPPEVAMLDARYFVQSEAANFVIQQLLKGGD